MADTARKFEPDVETTANPGGIHAQPSAERGQNRDMLGTVVLALLVLVLLLALLRSQKQIRDLLSERFYTGD